jgi:hypothetical protein
MLVEPAEVGLGGLKGGLDGSAPALVGETEFSG